MVAERFSSTCHEEGQAVGNCRGGLVDIDIFDLDLAPRGSAAKTHPLNLSPTDAEIGNMLLDREIIMRLAADLDGVHFRLRMAASLFIAARKGTDCGRLVTDFRRQNLMLREYFVPSALSSSVHNHLMLKDTEAYTELDF